MSEAGPQQATGNSQHGAGNSRVGSLLVIAAAALAIAPVLLWGPSCGHDFSFHAISWMDCLASWRHGILYPHWASTPNFGAGEPRFVFYPPLTWMLGAALGSFLPWTAVPPLLSFLLLAGIGLATRALAREALDEGAATLAGCLAIFSGYALFTTWERTAFAELAGGIWMPLLLLFILREASPHVPPDAPRPRQLLAWTTGGSTLPLALVVAAAWFSNAPVGVMASYLLAAMAIIVALLTRRTQPLIRAAVGLALGLSLAAVYLVPAAVEQKWVDIRQAIDDPGSQIQNSWLFQRHHTQQFEDHDIELAKVSVIGVSMIALALSGLALCWFRRRLPGGESWWLPVAAVPILVLLLQFPISLPIWNVLPKLRFLQFPWRWLVAVEAPMAVFLAAALTFRVRRGRLLLHTAIAVILAAAAFSAGFLFHQQCDQDSAISTMHDAQITGAGVQGNDEYAPPGADNTMVATGLPGACFVTDPAVQLGTGEPDLTPVWSPAQKTCRAVSSWNPAINPEHKVLQIAISKPGYLVLKLRRFPAWRITINGHPAQVLDTRQDGLTTISVPAGNLQIRADWTTTPDVTAGRWITAVALVILIVAALLRRGHARFHARPLLSGNPPTC